MHVLLYITNRSSLKWEESRLDLDWGASLVGRVEVEASEVCRREKGWVESGRWLSGGKEPRQNVPRRTRRA